MRDCGINAKEAISTHAPRTGGDRFTPSGAAIKMIIFQPTPPAQGATLSAYYLHQAIGISTHAPRTGGDISISDLSPATLGFQPTPPAQGATLDCDDPEYIQANFNPRPPHRGRPLFCCWGSFLSYFNPRPPHRGRRLLAACRSKKCYFNPRPPHRGRPRSRSL